jgi:hypothetical protein
MRGGRVGRSCEGRQRARPEAVVWRRVNYCYCTPGAVKKIELLDESKTYGCRSVVARLS